MWPILLIARRRAATASARFSGKLAPHHHPPSPRRGERGRTCLTDERPNLITRCCGFFWTLHGRERAWRARCCCSCAVVVTEDLRPRSEPPTRLSPDRASYGPKRRRMRSSVDSIGGRSPQPGFRNICDPTPSSSVTSAPHLLSPLLFSHHHSFTSTAHHHVCVP